MYLSTPTDAAPGPDTLRVAAGAVLASVVVWAVAAALLFVLVPGLDSFPRLLVFAQCVGLTMVACVLLLRRQRRLQRLATGPRWLLTGVIAIPVGYLLGHQIAFVLLGEPARLFGLQPISLVPILFTVLVGGLGLRHIAGREHLAREAAARAEAQLRLLRTQLEPHMLFNTLTTLRGLVREDADSAETMIDQLIVYLRGTLAASQTDAVPLAREFTQIRAYLDIMQLRMGPRLSWQLHLPAELNDLPVPPMLLQPLVENAIKHGLEPKVGAGRIEVSASATPAGIELRVDDNGLGPTQRDDDNDRPRSGYGLAHVRDRLRVVYGPGARLDVQPRQPEGASSVVFIPTREGSR